jgi:DNA-binding LytR/AlgR family response regulator
MINDRATIVLGHSPGSQTAYLLRLIDELRPKWRVATVVQSARQLAEEVDRQSPDFCILDMGDGMETSSLTGAHEIASYAPTLVLSQSCADAAVAFDIDATDFVSTKPLRKDRFEAALQRLQNAVGLQGGPRQLSSTECTAPRHARFLKIIDGSRVLVVPVEEVRYLQADQKYTRVFLGNRTGIVRQSLGAVYEHLNRELFWQMHRSTVINANFIREVERDDLGRLKVKVADYAHALQVAKPKERLFRDGIFV